MLISVWDDVLKLFCPQPKDIQFSVMAEERNEKIFI